MRLEAALLSGFSLGQLCLASNGFEAAHGLHHRRHADFHQQMRRDADAAVHQHQKRGDILNVGVWPTVVVPAGFTLAGGVQITPASVASNVFNSPASPTPTSVLAQQSGAAVAAAAASVNTTTWNAEAEKSCMNAVMALKGKATNPAGLAVCYNVPYLDQSKGVFEAELRMYNISAPTGEFVGVTPAMMMVTLQYAGAIIQQSNGQTPVKKRHLVERQMISTPTGVAMAGGLTGAMPAGIMMPTEIAIRQYVGQINKDLMVQGMNLTTFQALLVPQIIISAQNPTSQKQVNTTLSSTEASFNAGVFSNVAGNATDPKSLLGKPQLQIAAAAAGLPTPFDVPGLSLGIFPVGLIVTGSWMLIFFSVVGYGTFGRMQYRDQYRRAIKSQKEEAQRRI